MADDAIEQQQDFKQLRLLGIIFGAVIGLIVVGYFLVLRFNYATIYQNLSSEEASAVVAELDLREIKYRLKNGGSDIQVPAYKAASVRLTIVGAEAPAKKLVGFELFDESEMGLTDFAQKIKYQRALQGELARTIMMMDGVANARVHIAIPERALFRGNEASQPKAAVTIVTREAYREDVTLIAGIQRLVAAAVPELKTAQVVVLNAEGQEISKKPVMSQPVIAAESFEASGDVSLIADVESGVNVAITNEAGSSDTSSKTMVASADPNVLPSPTVAAAGVKALPAPVDVAANSAKPEKQTNAYPIWLAVALGFLVFIFIALLAKRVMKRAMNDTEREEFADTLRAKLAGMEESENVT